MTKYSKYHLNILFLLLAGIGLFLPAADTYAAAGGVPVTTGKVEDDHARIIFEWPQPGHFTAYLNQRRLSLSFDRNVNPDFAHVLADLYPYISSAQRSADRRTIVFTMDKPYRIRTFRSGNTNGIILLDIDPTRQRAYARAEPDNKAPQDSAKEASVSAEKDVETLNKANPAAGEKIDDKKAEGQKAAKAESKPAPEKREEPEERENAPPAKQDEPPNAAATKAIAPKAEVGDVAEPAKPANPPDKQEKEQAASDTEDKETASATPAADGRLKVSVSMAEDSATLRFPFNKRVASAVFIRSGMLWVVFDQPVELDLGDFDSLPDTVIGKAKAFSEAGVTVLRIPVASTVLPTIAKEAGKYEWAVLLAPKSRLLSNALNVVVKTDPPSPPHVFIPVLEMADTVELKDPQVGDMLAVTPLYNLGEGVMNRRDFIEFSLLDTAQGIVVSKKADDVQVLQLRSGLRISPHEGVTLTPGLPPVSGKDMKALSLQSKATLFPYEEWKVPEGETRNHFVHGLQHAIIETQTPEEANRIRIRLAKLYLSEGLAPEALAHLESIGRSDIVFYRSAKASALHGVANFLMARYAEAARDFSASELNNNKEIDFWRSLTGDLLGNPATYDYLALNDDYISKYPPVFRQKLAVVAADRSIENKDYNTALKIFDNMKKDHLLEPIQDYANYLLAVISAATGQEDEAIKMWDKLAKNDKAPFVQARAEFSRILWDMERGLIDSDQAIDRLERLRLSWHGDNMELKVLAVLGKLYEQKKDYANAMRVWDGGVSSFPNTAIAVEMERKLEDAFVSLFDEGTAGEMKPLEVLTLYYQYRDHAPGGAIGNQLVGLLADKLVSVDLLDEAAALLDKQMHESEKDQRSEVGAKLATIHLLNHDPENALKALEDSVYGDIPQHLLLWRDRLLAQSYSELGKYDKALKMVQNDLSPDAEQIRIGVHWQRKDWNNVINSVEALLKIREHVNKPLTLEESDAVLRLALAYIFEDNRVQLQYLRDYFEPLMANNPYQPLFNFITSKDVAPTPHNFDAVIHSIAQTRSFLENYRARIHTAGLSSVSSMAGDTSQTLKE